MVLNRFFTANPRVLTEIEEQRDRYLEQMGRQAKRNKPSQAQMNYLAKVGSTEEGILNESESIMQQMGSFGVSALGYTFNALKPFLTVLSLPHAIATSVVGSLVTTGAEYVFDMFNDADADIVKSGEKFVDRLSMGFTNALLQVWDTDQKGIVQHINPDTGEVYDMKHGYFGGAWAFEQYSNTSWEELGKWQQIGIQIGIEMAQDPSTFITGATALMSPMRQATKAGGKILKGIATKAAKGVTKEVGVEMATKVTKELTEAMMRVGKSSSAQRALPEAFEMLKGGSYDEAIAFLRKVGDDYKIPALKEVDILKAQSAGDELTKWMMNPDVAKLFDVNTKVLDSFGRVNSLTLKFARNAAEKMRIKNYDDVLGILSKTPDDELRRAGMSLSEIVNIKHKGVVNGQAVRYWGSSPERLVKITDKLDNVPALKWATDKVDLAKMSSAEIFDMVSKYGDGTGYRFVDLFDKAPRAHFFQVGLPFMSAPAITTDRAMKAAKVAHNVAKYGLGMGWASNPMWWGRAALHGSMATSVGKNFKKMYVKRFKTLFGEVYSPNIRTMTEGLDDPLIPYNPNSNNWWDGLRGKFVVNANAPMFAKMHDSFIDQVETSYGIVGEVLKKTMVKHGDIFKDVAERLEVLPGKVDVNDFLQMSIQQHYFHTVNSPELLDIIMPGKKIGWDDVVNDPALAKYAEDEIARKFFTPEGRLEMTNEYIAQAKNADTMGDDFMSLEDFNKMIEDAKNNLSDVDAAYGDAKMMGFKNDTKNYFDSILDLEDNFDVGERALGGGLNYLPFDVNDEVMEIFREIIKADDNSQGLHALLTSFEKQAKDDAFTLLGRSIKARKTRSTPISKFIKLWREGGVEAILEEPGMQQYINQFGLLDESYSPLADAFKRALIKAEKEGVDIVEGNTAALLTNRFKRHYVSSQTNGFAKQLRDFNYISEADSMLGTDYASQLVTQYFAPNGGMLKTSRVQKLLSSMTKEDRQRVFGVVLKGDITVDTVVDKLPKLIQNAVDKGVNIERIDKALKKAIGFGVDDLDTAEGLFDLKKALINSDKKGHNMQLLLGDSWRQTLGINSGESMESVLGLKGIDDLTADDLLTGLKDDVFQKQYLQGADDAKAGIAHIEAGKYSGEEVSNVSDFLDDVNKRFPTKEGTYSQEPAIQRRAIKAQDKATKTAETAAKDSLEHVNAQKELDSLTRERLEAALAANPKKRVRLETLESELTQAQEKHLKVISDGATVSTSDAVGEVPWEEMPPKATIRGENAPAEFVERTTTYARNILKKLGYKRSYKSKSGSQYYKRTFKHKTDPHKEIDDVVRIADHEIPSTGARRYTGHTSPMDRDMVFTGYETKAEIREEIKGQFFDEWHGSAITEPPYDKYHMTDIEDFYTPKAATPKQIKAAKEAVSTASEKLRKHKAGLTPVSKVEGRLTKHSKALDKAEDEAVKLTEKRTIIDEGIKHSEKNIDFFNKQMKRAEAKVEKLDGAVARMEAQIAKAEGKFKGAKATPAEKALRKTLGAAERKALAAIKASRKEQIALQRTLKGKIGQEAREIAKLKKRVPTPESLAKAQADMKKALAEYDDFVKKVHQAGKGNGEFVELAGDVDLLKARIKASDANRAAKRSSGIATRAADRVAVTKASVDRVLETIPLELTDDTVATLRLKTKLGTEWTTREIALAKKVLNQEKGRGQTYRNIYEGLAANIKSEKNIATVKLDQGKSAVILRSTLMDMLDYAKNKEDLSQINRWLNNQDMGIGFGRVNADGRTSYDVLNMASRIGYSKTVLHQMSDSLMGELSATATRLRSVIRMDPPRSGLMGTAMRLIPGLTRTLSGLNLYGAKTIAVTNTFGNMMLTMAFGGNPVNIVRGLVNYAVGKAGKGLTRELVPGLTVGKHMELCRAHGVVQGWAKAAWEMLSGKSAAGVTKAERSLFRKVLKKANRGVVGGAGWLISKTLDEPFRYAFHYDLMKQGHSFSMATEMVKKALGDFSISKTTMGDKYISKMSMFYRFKKHILRQQSRLLATDPKWAMFIAKYNSAQVHAMSGEETWVSENMKPEYMPVGYAQRVKGDKWDSQGRHISAEYAIYNPFQGWYPAADLMEWTNPVKAALESIIFSPDIMPSRMGVFNRTGAAFEAMNNAFTGEDPEGLRKAMAHLLKTNRATKYFAPLWEDKQDAGQEVWKRLKGGLDPTSLSRTLSYAYEVDTSEILSKMRRQLTPREGETPTMMQSSLLKRVRRLQTNNSWNYAKMPWKNLYEFGDM